MNKVRIALIAASSLVYAGLATAQTPAAAPDHHHPDMAELHKAMCGDRLAHEAAHLAFVEAKLELTEAQKPLFAKFRQIVLDSAAKEKAACLATTPKADAKPTILDREAHAEAMLAAKLDGLKASKGALQALYDSLTPTQRHVLDHSGHHGGWGHHHGMMGHEGAGRAKE